jgi:hypothetical protein
MEAGDYDPRGHLEVVASCIRYLFFSSLELFGVRAQASKLLAYVDSITLHCPAERSRSECYFIPT